MVGLGCTCHQKKLKLKRASISFGGLLSCILVPSRPVPSFCPGCHCSCLILLPAIIFETLHSGTSIATGEPLERQLHWWRELFLSLSMSSILLLLLLLLSKCNNSEKVPATEYDMTAIGPPPSLILLLAGLGLVMWGVLWSAVIIIIIISLPTFRNVKPLLLSFLLQGVAVGVQTRRRRMKKGAPRAVVNNKEYPQCNRVAKLCDGLL